MNTRDKILNMDNLKSAMKERNSVKVSILRFLKSEIQRIEGGKSIMNENQIVNLVKKNIDISSGVISDPSGKKYINESSRKEGWEQEVEILESFLPTQLTKIEMEIILDDLIKSGLSKIGPIMGKVLKEYEGRVDGEVLSTMVSEKLK